MAIVVRQNRPLTLKDLAICQVKDTAAWLRDYVTAIKHGQLHPFTPVERKAREATRNEAWGPTGTLLNELAEASFDSASCEIVFAVIQMRLSYPSDKWRNVYKGLTVLEFLLKRGSDQCVRITRNELMYKLEDLEAFESVTSEGRDNGVNVRHRAQAIRTLLKDEPRLNQERQAFKTKRKAYQGFSRDDMAGTSSGARPAFDTDTNLHTGHSDDEEVVSTRRSRSNQDEVQSGYGSQANNTPGVSSRHTPATTRNAGEMKGVTMEENKRYLAALKTLLERPENRACADCRDGGAAGRSSWASINTGVFICMRCAGIHRGLGVHISKVRSCTLDTWLPAQVRFMARTGNARANAFYEARCNPGDKPDHHSPDLETFIRRKYARDYAEGEWPPADALAEPAATESRAEGDVLSPGPAASTAGSKLYGGAAQAGKFWASQDASSAPAPSPSAHLMDEGFGESAFSGDEGFDSIAFARTSAPAAQPAVHAAPATVSAVPSQPSAASQAVPGRGLTSYAARQSRPQLSVPLPNGAQQPSTAAAPVEAGLPSMRPPPAPIVDLMDFDHQARAPAAAAQVSAVPASAAAGAATSYAPAQRGVSGLDELLAGPNLLDDDLYGPAGLPPMTDLLVATPYSHPGQQSAAPKESAVRPRSLEGSFSDYQASPGMPSTGFSGIAASRTNGAYPQAAEPAQPRVPQFDDSPTPNNQAAYYANGTVAAPSSQPSYLAPQASHTPTPLAVATSHPAAPVTTASLGFEESTSFSPMKGAGHDGPPLAISALFGPGIQPSANGSYRPIVPSAPRTYSPLQAKYSPAMQPRHPSQPVPGTLKPQILSGPTPGALSTSTASGAAVSGLGFEGASGSGAGPAPSYSGALVPKVAPAKPWSPASPSQERKSVLEDLFVSAVEGLALPNHQNVVQIIRPAGPAPSMAVRRMTSMKEQRLAGQADLTGSGKLAPGAGTQVQVYSDATGSVPPPGTVWASQALGSGELHSRPVDQIVV